MTSKALDRRVQRTQQALYDALTTLILEKRYDKITVQDIIERANVGRSTFYAYFLDKEDLLVKAFASFSEQAKVQRKTAATGQEATLPLLHSLAFFRHADSHHHLHQALVKSGGADVLLGTVRQHLQEDIQRQLEQLFPADKSVPIPLPIIAIFLTGAMMAMVTWWLEAERPCSVEEMNTMFQQLALTTVEKLYTGDLDRSY